MKNIFAFLFVFATALSSWSADHVLSAQIVNKQLSRTNSTWKAQDNWVSRLPKADVKKMLGALGVKKRDISFSVPEVMTLIAPETLDWRNKDGQNWLGPVMNQANCGSCVAFAAVATL